MTMMMMTLRTMWLQAACIAELQRSSSSYKSVKYTASQKHPRGFLTFFQNGWQLLVQILHAYYTFASTLDYSIISNRDEVMPY